MDSENEIFNRNDRQQNFNSIKGTICELNNADIFCSMTLDVGHENIRKVNINAKKFQFDKIAEKFKIGDKVNVLFYVTSRMKNNRYYTAINVLQVDLI